MDRGFHSLTRHPHLAEIAQHPHGDMAGLPVKDDIDIGVLEADPPQGDLVDEDR